MRLHDTFTITIQLYHCVNSRHSDPSNFTWIEDPDPLHIRNDRY